MKRYVRTATDIPHLSDILKRVVCIKFCDDLNREPTRLEESSRIYADESMDDYLPDDNYIMTYNDDQLLGMYNDPELKVKMESLTKPELLVRLRKLCKDNLTPEQLSIAYEYIKNKKVEIDSEGVEKLLERMKKCNNVVYLGSHNDTNIFILDEDGNIRKTDCLDVVKSLTVKNWIDEMNGLDDHYFGDILIVFQTHTDWVDNDGNVQEDLCIYIKVDLNLTSGDAVLIVTMHPADTDNNVD